MRVRVRCQFGYQKRVFKALLKSLYGVTLVGEKLDFSLSAEVIVESIREGGFYGEKDNDLVRACKANGIEIWVE